MSFEECLNSNLIISLQDSQMLTSIRDITGRIIDRDKLEEWYFERDKLKKSKNLTREKKKRIRELQKNIYDLMYIPEYITVVMESIKDYTILFKNGFKFNGHTYRRASCSASQARVSTIVFVDEAIKDELKKRLDNGRDLNHPQAPSKYNAYLGLYSSSIKVVSNPRFCIVPDCEKAYDVDVNFVIEQDKDSDDVIEERIISNTFNLFDGSGLISPQMAEQWGKDLKEDYTPCNFCLRWSFTKGMVNTFDYIKWCDEYNNGNYFIKDVYGNLVDLREIDVILSEGQVKMWNFWETQEDLERNSKQNGIVWGITKYSPKQDKKVLMTNYQYLQTLKLNDSMIEDLCSDTLNYIKGVSYNDIYYTLLFLMGENNIEQDVNRFFKNSDNYWLKTLALNHNLLNDKYTKEKIRDYIVKKIEQACLGRLIVKGNYMCICPDPFAYMQWICYRDKNKVTGLLGPHEAYVDFWFNNGLKDGDKVDSMRSPLTHFSEHGIDTLRCTDEMKKWYSYCYSGYICNIKDEFTMIHAGSDYDYDIISSTNNINFVQGKYPNQKVVTYNAKKPQKKIFTEEDLFTTDCFSFGTQIGQITNCCSSICALLANFNENSEEYKTLNDRLAAGCAAQSR